MKTLTQLRLGFGIAALIHAALLVVGLEPIGARFLGVGLFAFFFAVFIIFMMPENELVQDEPEALENDLVSETEKFLKEQ